MKKVLFFALLAGCLSSSAQSLRWRLAADGGITWDVNAGPPHTDHIEMSGRFISAIITYGTDSLHQLVWKRRLVFPMLRMLPNDTRGSLQDSFDDNIIDSITADGQPLKETPLQFTINGYLRVVSSTNTTIRVERTLYPSVDKAACLEKYILTNTGTQPVSVQIPSMDKSRTTNPAKSVYGSYILHQRSYETGTLPLAPGESYNFYVAFSGRRATEDAYHFSADYELDKRRQLVDGLRSTLVLHTPNDTLNNMFAFAKIRATESIFDTKEGLMHGPGGGSYYAAIWANDQAEYVGPFFPFLGNSEGNESARNCYRYLPTI